MKLKVYFSDFFEIDPTIIEKYGAFNISLINDLPLFIDPFLLFNSTNPKYKLLHENMLKYLRFLQEKSQEKGVIPSGLLKAWYMFPEIKQNWLGFSKSGNSGSGLGNDFAVALHENLNLFTDFGWEKITKSSHLEKLCIIKEGVGKDNISDFTTRLIHDYLLNYTQNFALTYLKADHIKRVHVDNVRFNYKTETWERDFFQLPFINNDYVLLTPIDILTKDDTWINKTDIVKDFSLIPASISDEQLRAQINNYFYSILPKKPAQKDKQDAVNRVINKYPSFIDYYIKYKEEQGNKAKAISNDKVEESVTIYVEQYQRLIHLLNTETDFYKKTDDTLKESLERVQFLKHVIENNDGYRLFYIKGNPIKREEDLQILYRLTWFASISDVNREVNNGRGPVDFKVSRGDKDKTLIEFKLASNTQLKRNLMNQVDIYEQANKTKKSIKVILYFTESELAKVDKIMNELGLNESDNIILIDARKDNKASASTA